jgi:lambda family phage portal protein
MAAPGRRGAAARARKKDVQDAQNRYDAAGNGRRLAGWSPGSRGPRTASDGTTRMRDRAQDSVRNDWPSAATTQRWSTTLIGVGITPRWKSKELRKRWNKFVKQADADHVLDAYGLQTLAVRAWFTDGEVFLRRRPRSLTLGLDAPVQVQLIESAYCPMFDATAWQGMPAGNEIRQGIEFNKFGLRVAYWMYREHPHDPNARATPDRLIRVPASEIRHMFEPKRPGQVRGVSELAAMLIRIRNSVDFEDAVLERQKLANLYVAFITRQLPELDSEDYDPETGMPKWYDKAGNVLAGMSPGISQELAPGEDVKFANPPEAGMPFELLSGDIKDISDRTLRVVMNEFRRLARQRQWQIVIHMHCQQVVEWWADALFLKGDLGESELEEAKAPTWAPDGWEYIHPTQDAEGKKIEFEMGTKSRMRIALERGDDIEDIDDEREEDLKRSKAKGLEPPPPPAPGAGKPVGPKPPTPKAERREDLEMRLLEARVDAAVAPPAPLPAPVPSAAEIAQAVVAPLMAEFRQVQAAEREAASAAFIAAQQATAERFAQLAQAAIERSINVTNEVPTPIVNVAAPDVTVNNNVEPTSVHVDVQPAPLTVQNNVNVTDVAITSMPTRQTTTDVRRDAAGEILDTQTIERDAPKPKKE